jgi:hypothetical protein
MILKIILNDCNMLVGIALETLEFQSLQQIVTIYQISNYKHCNNIVTISQIWNYKQSVTNSKQRSCNLTLAPQQHSKQSITIPGMGGTHAVGDGSPSAAMLVVGRGSRGGSTSPSGVALVKGIHHTGLRIP